KLTPPSTLPDGDTAPERIAPAEGHPTGEKHEHPRSRLPHLEQHRSIRVGAALPEAGCPGNIGLVHWGEDLVEPPFQVREFRTGRQGWKIGNDVVGVGHGSNLLHASYRRTRPLASCTARSPGHSHNSHGALLGYSTRRKQ